MFRYFFSDSQQIKRVFLLFHLVWLLTITASVGIIYRNSHRAMEQTALAEARAVYNRDMDFRRWLAKVGGVYAAVSDLIPPNPYLAHIPDRDISKPDGTPLTLVNPAYLIRLVNESSPPNGKASTRMTSTRPLHPDNRPDPWEAAALQRAEGGQQEVYEFTTIAGQPTLRYLHTAMAEAPCLKCHASQGYRLGDLRGGLVVSLPIGALLASHESTMRTFYFWHLVIYLLGITFLYGSQRFISRQVRDRTLTMEALAENEANFRTIADFAHAWEYWMLPDGSMKYVSPSVQAITGYPPERFLADPGFIKSILVGDMEKFMHDHLDNDLRHQDDEADVQIRTAAGEIRWLHHICRPIHDRHGVFLGRRASNYDITEEKTAKLRNEELITKLREALDKVKTLSGFLPICASCKKIRDDQGYWSQIEAYVAKHSEAVFSHGICPDCAHRLYPDITFPTTAKPTAEPEKDGGNDEKGTTRGGR